MERAYFPWIGALHVLLDSLIDRAADTESGHHSLVDHYASIEEAAARLSRSPRALSGHQDGPRRHSARDDPRGDDELLPVDAACHRARGGVVARGVLEAMGTLGHAHDVVLRARRAAGRLLGAVSRDHPSSVLPSKPCTGNSSIGLSTCRRVSARHDRAWKLDRRGLRRVGVQHPAFVSPESGPGASASGSRSHRTDRL